MTLSCPRCVVAAAGFSPATTALGPVVPHSRATLRALPQAWTEKGAFNSRNHKARPVAGARTVQEMDTLGPKMGGKLDDDIVGEIVDDATREELDELLALLDADEAFWKELYAWLGGPESESKPLTNEYCAFHCLGVALDYAKLRRKREDHPEAFRTPSVHSSPSASINTIIRKQYANRPRLRAICDAIIDAAKAFQSLGNRGDPVEAAREVVISAGRGVVGLSTRRRSFARIQPSSDGG